LKDLNGKSIAYTDELSTSGYLYPKSMVQRAGVKTGHEVFARKHDEVIKLVYEGKADAGAAFYSPPSSKGEIHDARARVKAQYPDVEKKVIVLATTDPIPNDPIVFSKKFDAETARKLYTALVKFSTGTLWYRRIHQGIGQRL
jgi:phosphonate transport system substrate-binding protein